MRKWKVLAAILAVAFVVPTSFAQTQEFIQDLTALKDRVAKLETENAELKSSVTDQNAQELDSQINALTDRLLLDPTTVNSGANPVTLSGEFRFRNAVHIGDTNGAENDGSWTDARIDLGFQYDFSPNVTAYAETQNDWAFGNGPGGVNLHQGWLEVRNVFGRAELSTRTGRQEITFGKEFQFGDSDWYDGLSHDATRWDWTGESFNLTGLYLRRTGQNDDVNQQSAWNQSHDTHALYGLYFTLKTIENHTLDLYWLYNDDHDGVAAGANEYWSTLGGRLGGNLDGVMGAGLDWNVEAAYQFGSADGGVQDVDAWTIEAEAGVSFDGGFRLYGRFLYAEGADGGDNGYALNFPERHSNGVGRARYGSADVMPMTNVLSLQGGFSWSATEDWTLGATVIWSEVENDSDDYGTELDLWAEHTYSANLTYGLGLAFVFPGDRLESAAFFNDNDTQFIGYVQARLTF